ncbi:MAG: hypothetical protein OEZ13_01015 [Spirochaetia bacterium]|nr:hypothetical protein [Spirochaetia bacterium]
MFKISRLLYIISLFIFCAAPPKKNIIKPYSYSIDEFKKQNWYNKIKVLENIEGISKEGNERDLLNSAIEDKNIAIKKEALRKIQKLKLKEYKSKALNLTSHKDPIIRWYSLYFLEGLDSEKEILPVFTQRFKDKEWLVRESAFRGVRKFENEKKTKEYFFSILFSLDEKNPLVLRQIYKTLYWYEDSRALPYLLKRSYHASTNTELMFILIELARYRNSDVKKRLRQVIESHPDRVVRNFALKLYIKK